MADCVLDVLLHVTEDMFKAVATFLYYIVNRKIALLFPNVSSVFETSAFIYENDV